MAGLTVAIQKRSVFGNKRVRVVDVDFDTSYPTNGEALTGADLGLSVVDIVIPSPKSGYVFEYDYTNSKLKAYYSRGAVSGTLAASVDAGATTVTSTAANGSIITLSGDAAVAAGPGEEVANATDLHTVTGVRLLAMGV